MSEQRDLIKKQKELKSVETYEFDIEPIRGYPELRWAGKRPFHSTRYYPAQHKETHGTETNGWMNELYWGDNLQVMSHLLKKYRGQVDLIYIDPPFDSKAEYKKKISLKGKNAEGDQSGFEEKQYNDIWTNDEYLQFMYERLIICRELISKNGCIYLHMDEKRAHLLKVILDEVFGASNFKREIVWSLGTASGFKAKARNWIRQHDILLYYTKSKQYKFSKLYFPHKQDYIDRFDKMDEDGRRYRDDREDGRVQYLENSLGTRIGDVWSDIMSFQQASTSLEYLKYPTQKPEALLERIIKGSTTPGDLVFDAFMGSGTTQAVAMKLGRRFLGADINLGAIQTTTKRLISIQQEMAEKGNQVELPFVSSSPIEESDEAEENVNAETKNYPIYSGFHVYTVNDYDIFRNPVQAKELLREALEVEPLTTSTVFDGEKDGALVKIMPVNRIATKEDLNDIITSLNFKEFEKRNKEKPGKIVEKILLVCMGHDPDLKAELEKAAQPYRIDVQVVDILRDRSDLHFKREAEAKIKIKGSGKSKKLVIEKFYPLNLMQKLSMEKSVVSDWRELVETVMIDFYYDDAVLNPQIVDIPEKNGFVKGEYSLPEDHGKIHVKITDLISESLEMTVEE